ncbi:Alpha/beta hydrolase family protein [Actinomadura rubteroloni]|uniref:Acyl-CoA:diacylglycerol acyltransferase n=1 Tax=Actinomadura rubteroloni TaxID=1926885 RepID=A0A2P4UHP9_9ACTN|nr:alpha/beta hydrolase-fold protein [Actinomadura rubteroloni]POM24551.1 Alpha/beta hydrolase family protein [Actinomadura rubteroloni]
MISRRLVLAGLGGAGGLAAAGLGGVGLVEARVLPGRVRLDRALGRCGSLPPVPSEQADVREERWRSAARGTDVAMTVVTPRGVPARGLPVVVALHGAGGDHRAVLVLCLDRYLAHAVAHGTPPFAVVGVDGGATYWHRRATGDDPLAMITGEVLPRLARRGLRTDRIGLLGWSMGGYGALLAAERLGAGRVAAVAASSPALFASLEAARGANRTAFDDADDFARNDVFAGLDALRPVPAWIDCGTSDTFAPRAGRLRDRLRPKPAGGLFGGCHDGPYWMRRAPGHLDFLGRRLARGV